VEGAGHVPGHIEDMCVVVRQPPSAIWRPLNPGVTMWVSRRSNFELSQRLSASFASATTLAS
jgi:hypothetical protein